MQGVASGVPVVISSVNQGGVVITSDPNDDSLLGLLIQGVTFDQKGSTSDFGVYQWIEGVDFTYGGSIAAQGGTPIVQVFDSHVIVMYGDKFYDTSYGGVFDTPLEWENTALSGVYLFDLTTNRKYGYQKETNTQRLTAFSIIASMSV